MLHTLRTKQLLHTTLPELWSFMSSPKNLSLITPSYMGFKILSNEEDIEHMYPGQLIEYYVSPLIGIKMHWVTEITHVKEMNYFVDEQRFGPYSFWHHQHFLKEVSNGVEMTDILHYQLPFGFIGKIVDQLFVKNKVSHIFNYRYAKLEELFGAKK